MSTHVNRSATSVVVRDPTASATEVRRLIDSCVRRHLAAYDPAKSGVLALRRLKLRLVAPHGLPTRDRLGKAWVRALDAAIARHLEGVMPGVGDDVVWFETQHAAQRAWLLSWTTHAARPWWSPTVAQSMDVRDPLEPAHVLLYWAEHAPELLPAEVCALLPWHAALTVLTGDDWLAVWSTYDRALRRWPSGSRVPSLQTLGSDEAIDALRRSLRDAEITETTSARDLVVARLLARQAIPSVTATEAIDAVVAQVLAEVTDEVTGYSINTSSSEPTEARPAHIAESAPTWDELSQPPEMPAAGVEAEGPRERTMEAFEYGGFTLLFHPLLGEARRRVDEGETFSMSWQALVHAAFWTVHGPRREHLRYAVEREGDFFWWWFAVRPTADWLDAPCSGNVAFVTEVAESLPIDWGASGLERLRHLVRRAAQVRADLPYVQAVFTLDQSDIEVRRRGWDIDPGWVPALDRVLRFHYEEES